jgi:hypothetical protein
MGISHISGKDRYWRSKTGGIMVGERAADMLPAAVGAA